MGTRVMRGSVCALGPPLSGRWWLWPPMYRGERNPEKEEGYLYVVVVRLATLVTMTKRSWSRTAYITR
jgi:hypothetical protein